MELFSFCWKACYSELLLHGKEFSNCSGEGEPVSSSFFISTVLPHLLSRIKPMEKSLKVLRIETWFQWHTGKSGIHLLSSEKGLNQSPVGDLMRQIIEHSLIQVTTYVDQQTASVLADLFRKRLAQAQKEIKASTTWAFLVEKWQQRTNASITSHSIVHAASKPLLLPPHFSGNMEL